MVQTFLPFKLHWQGTAFVRVIEASGRVVRNRDSAYYMEPKTMILRVYDLTSGTYDRHLLTTVHGGEQHIRSIKE